MKKKAFYLVSIIGIILGIVSLVLEIKNGTLSTVSILFDALMLYIIVDGVVRYYIENKK